ncbi:MarR family winged helix-turn-helix transcriptional regulator [Flavobacterium kingsejongi]|uniref:MarR family transcriptional regulator n=1 Tax=Flavobacterium kingsejongi TaxID=1678728 RepID=A0A2S1LSZ3_9FLAO|nr:MarR family transcriptional regulator [Flavobacterium kingsejongi]AWG26781.1 MarR family transcriptional regulator [Flavobacterium kingsejongi]
MKIEAVIKTEKALTLSKQVLLNILHTQNVLQEKFNEVLKPYEISGEQFNVLRILRGQNGNPANMCVIQERMIAKTSNTTRLVDKLLLKKLVTREICKNNRRKVEIKITDKGLGLLNDLDPKIVCHEQRFSDNLAENELLQLIELLEKFRNE